MIKNNYGRIVNVASVAGKDGNANASAYSSGKAGAIGLTKSLGKELADKKIEIIRKQQEYLKEKQSEIFYLILYKGKRFKNRLFYSAIFSH